MRFTQVGATALLATHVFAHPKSSSTSRSGLQRRVIDLSAFRLKTIPAYSNATVTTSNPSVVKRGDWIDTATALVQKIAPGAEFRLVEDHYVGLNGVAHANFKQTVHGLDIDNADFNVNVSINQSIDQPMNQTRLLLKLDRLQKMELSSHTETLSTLEPSLPKAP